MVTLDHSYRCYEIYSVRRVQHLITIQTNLLYVLCVWAGISQSVWPLAMGRTVQGSNTGGGEIFRTRPDQPWGPSSLLCSGYRVSFPDVKRPGRGVEQPAPSSAFSLGVHSWLVLVWPLPFTSCPVGTSHGHRVFSVCTWQHLMWSPRTDRQQEAIL
jgi:hypothetical protein